MTTQAKHIYSPRRQKRPQTRKIRDIETRLLNDFNNFLEGFEKDKIDTIQIDTSPIKFGKSDEAKNFFRNWLKKSGYHHLKKVGHRGYLPKGTKIYHGSINKIGNFDKLKSVYFSLYPDVSFWILTEQYHRSYQDIKNMDAPNIGFLYEFEIKYDLPVLFNDDMFVGGPPQEIDEEFWASFDPDIQRLCHRLVPCLQAREGLINIYPKELKYPECFETNLCYSDKLFSGGLDGVELIMPGRFVHKYLKFNRAYVIDIDILFSLDCGFADEGEEWKDTWSLYLNFDPYTSIVGEIKDPNPLAN